MIQNHRRRGPNFFILGAAKCGTTSLYHYLVQHPQIYMSPNKEPSFFCDLFQVISNPIDYARLFEDVVDEPCIGEASHVYLTCPRTAPVLQMFFPQAKFIVILRHPVDRAFSLYHGMVRRGDEWLGTFEAALAAEERRCRDPRFQRRNPHYFYSYLYFQSGLYADQIERYFQYFSRDRFLFLNFDELKSDCLGLLSRIFRFLEVDPSFVPHLERHNSGRPVRSAYWQYFVKHRLAPTLTWLQVKHRGRIVEWLRQRNLTESPLPKMRAETRAMLQERYTADMIRVQQLTSLNLCGWLSINGASATDRAA